MEVSANADIDSVICWQIIDEYVSLIFHLLGMRKNGTIYDVYHIFRITGILKTSRETRAGFPIREGKGGAFPRQISNSFCQNFSYYFCIFC